MSLVNALKSPLSAVFGLFSPGATSKLTSLETTNLEHEGQKLVSPEGAPLNEKADFRIEGMTCGACVEVSKLLPSHLSVASDFSLNYLWPIIGAWAHRSVAIKGDACSVLPLPH